MTECRHLRTCFASKLNQINPMNNLKNIHNFKKVSASSVSVTTRSAQTYDVDAKHYNHFSLFKRNDYPISKSFNKFQGLESQQKSLFKLKRSGISGISIGFESNSSQLQKLSPLVLSIREYSSLSMGLISGKCERNSRQCACCSKSLSNCSCNCEKSTRCLCAGPHNVHRIGIAPHSRWFSTSKALNSKDLIGTDLLREPNVNKVCPFIHLRFCRNHSLYLCHCFVISFPISSDIQKSPNN